jgi:site-specific recombinase XerD
MTKRAPKRVRLSRKDLERHFQAFVDHLNGKRPETRGTYQRALREFVRWFALDGDVRFTVSDVERYKRHLTLRKKLSPVSVSTYLTAVRCFCEFLLSRGVLAENPARSVGGNQRPRTHSRDMLSVEEVDRLLASVETSDERGKRDLAMIRLMLGCGLSEIEIIRADIRDLRTSGGQAALLVQGKGHTVKDELVFLGDDVRSALQDYMAVRASATPGEPLFASAGNRTRGERMTTRGVRDRINACLERAGVRGNTGRRITPYSLRHTAAALLARGGASEEELQKRMRLGSLATARLYLSKSLPDD